VIEDTTRGDRAKDSDTEKLSELFWSVARRLRHSSREALAPWDIAPSHSRALGVLMQHQALRLSELSDHLHIAPRSTTDVVDGLQQRGLIQRSPDPHDRRAMLVSLTDQGRRAGIAIRAARDADAERFFAALRDADRKELARILRTLRGSAPGP
jgi:DNA-binding MarR family transcriptional regulator